MLSQTFRTNTKNLLKKYLPEKIFTQIRKYFIVYFSKYFNTQKIEEKYTKIFLEKYGYKVLEGPFQNMKYVKTSIGSSFLHKLAGFYEAVLHPFIYEISEKNVENILDIGSAEGYYTTGFGKIFPNAEIIAFEMDPLGRDLILEMYKINNLKNKIQIQGEATKENINQYLTEKTLLICDCEGAEKYIFENSKKENLQNIVFGIIELHDEFVPNCKETLQKVFSETHNIEIIKFEFADPQKFTFLKFIENKDDLMILQKERGIQDQEWMILRNKFI